MFKMINFTSRVFYCNLIETAFICWSPCQGRGPGWTPDLAGTALRNSSSPPCEDPLAGSLPMPVVKTGRSEALNTPRHPPSSQHSPSVSATEDARARRADGRGGARRADRGGGRTGAEGGGARRGAEGGEEGAWAPGPLQWSAARPRPRAGAAPHAWRQGPGAAPLHPLHTAAAPLGGPV